MRVVRTLNGSRSISVSRLFPTMSKKSFSARSLQRQAPAGTSLRHISRLSARSDYLRISNTCSKLVDLCFLICISFMFLPVIPSDSLDQMVQSPPISCVHNNYVDSITVFYTHLIHRSRMIDPFCVVPSFISGGCYRQPALRVAWARNFSSLPPHVELQMPALSPTMTQGNITVYKVKVGDKLSPGDLICDIESDKATIGWEAQEEGYVAAILVPEGTQEVRVGKTVLILVEDKALVPAFANYVPSQSAGPAAAAAPAAAVPPATPAPSAPPPPSANYPPHSILQMPALSPTMTQVPAARAAPSRRPVCYSRRHRGPRVKAHHDSPRLISP